MSGVLGAPLRAALKVVQFTPWDFAQAILDLSCKVANVSFKFLIHITDLPSIEEFYYHINLSRKGDLNPWCLGIRLG